MENQGQLTTSESTISTISRGYLLETAKWGKFLGIIGFIFCGLIAIMSLFMGTIFSSVLKTGNMPFNGGGAVIGIVYLVMGLIYFFPVLYLYKFSTKLKTSLLTDDVESLEVAFRNQKSLFKFMGVFTIILLGFYALIFIGSLLGGFLGGMMG